MNNFYKFLFIFVFSISSTSSLTSSLTSSRLTATFVPPMSNKLMDDLYKAADGHPSYKGKLKLLLKQAEAQGIDVVRLRDPFLKESLLEVAASTISRVSSDTIEIDNLRELLKYPFDVNNSDTCFGTPLYQIGKSNGINLKDKYARIKLLIEAGADVTKPSISRYNETVFHALAQSYRYSSSLGTKEAIKKAVEEIVDLILTKVPKKEHPAFINRRNEFGDAALHFAAESWGGLYHEPYQEELFNTLIEKGADPILKNRKEEDPNDILKRDERSIHEHKEELSPESSNSPTFSSSLLSFGYCLGSSSSSFSSLSSSSSASSAYQEKDTDLPLVHAVVKEGNLSVLKKLLTQDRTQLERETNTFHWRPLHMALLYNQPHIADYLIEQGADIHAETNYGFRVISSAILGNVNNVLLLIKLLNAKATLNDKQGNDLHYACRMKNVLLLKLIFEHRKEDALKLINLPWICPGDYNKPKSECTESSLETPLYEAIRSRSVECIEILCKHGADLTVKDKDGCTPLGFARYLNYTECVEALTKIRAERS